jgi:hypothetical protein
VVAAMTAFISLFQTQRTSINFEVAHPGLHVVVVVAVVVVVGVVVVVVVVDFGQTII